MGGKQTSLDLKFNIEKQAANQCNFYALEWETKLSIGNRMKLGLNSNFLLFALVRIISWGISGNLMVFLPPCFAHLYTILWFVSMVIQGNIVHVCFTICFYKGLTLVTIRLPYTLERGCMPTYTHVLLSISAIAIIMHTYFKPKLWHSIQILCGIRMS